jgi:hypothetical protein
VSAIEPRPPATELCILEQYLPGRIGTVVGMQRENVKSAIVGGWVLGLGAIAVSFGVDSAKGWMLLVGLGVVPPLMLFRMWRQPAPTMSESIHEVLK